MIHPVSDKLRSGLLENGGALPRFVDGVVSIIALQHVDSAAHDVVDQHTMRVRPGGVPPPSLDAEDVHTA